jgi:RNA polymerase sigma-70 factor, ECF subfamily
MDDESLVRMLEHGHEQAVVDLYRKYLNPIYRFFYYQTNQTKEVAEDLTSQTFLEFIRSVKKYEGRGSIKAYLYGIAKMELMDYIKNKYKEPTLPLFESLSIHEEILDEEEMNKKLEQIELLIAKLSDREQTAVRMRYLQGATSEEVATKLNLSVSNVKVIVHRAIRKLSRLEV